MNPITDLPTTQREELLTSLREEYKAIKSQNLKLDMTRGKPSPEQLDLAGGLLDTDQYTAEDGTDCRNYGGLDGLPEMKALFAQMLDTQASNVIVGGNSSLTMMYDALVRACLFGKQEGDTPWSAQTKRFLCPSPGYDRHFKITQTLGFELVMVEMSEDGPNMHQVRQLVADDASIKGIWCVPKYSNPTGASYSDEVVRALAQMPCAADDFTIMWDNAYAEHHLDGEVDQLLDIIKACDAAGHPNRPFVFASTSKISYAGSGVACFASSPENVARAKALIGVQSIGPDKINQLRHLRLFKDINAVREHMARHAAILKPKFERVEAILNEQLGDADIASWTRPRGGYFTSLDMHLGSAKQVIELSAALGVKLTEAGAPFPYGDDPQDKNIRIAPSFPSLDEIDAATTVLALCVKIAALEASLAHH